MARPRAIVFLSGFALSLVALVAAGCGNGAPSSARREASAAAPGGAELVVVAVRPGGSTGTEFQGFLEPIVDAVVPAQAAGIVREIFVREGARVARGARLARLEDEEQRLEVEYNSALAEQAAAELARAEKGAAGQFVSRQSLDAARAKARATRVDLDLARLAYARRTLRAPVAGVVWQVRAELHRLVAADDVLFHVTDPTRLRTHLHLPAALRGHMAVGAAVRLTLTGEPVASAIEGRVRTVSPMVDPATGRFRVEVEVTGKEGSLAGQTVEAAFPDLGAGAAGGGAVLPDAALVERDGDRLVVWRIRDGVAHRVPVELGTRRPDGFEVLAGLAPGDLVAARGSTPPADGAPVRTRLAAGGGD